MGKTYFSNLICIKHAIIFSKHPPMHSAGLMWCIGSPCKEESHLVSIAYKKLPLECPSSTLNYLKVWLWNYKLRSSTFGINSQGLLLSLALNLSVSKNKKIMTFLFQFIAAFLTITAPFVFVFALGKLNMKRPSFVCLHLVFGILSIFTKNQMLKCECNVQPNVSLFVESHNHRTHTWFKSIIKIRMQDACLR